MAGVMRSWLPGPGVPHGPLSTVFGGRGGLCALLLAFLAVDVALQWLGHRLQEQPGAPTVLWPASGFLFATFWLTGRSLWPLLGGLHILIETFSIQSQGDWWSPALIGCADVLDSLIGVTLARRWIREPDRIRVHQVGLFVLAAAISTGIGALLGTAVSTSYRYPDMGYWPQMQLWWTGNWLGTVSFALPLCFWAMSYWRANPEVRLASRRELAAYCMLLPAVSLYVFTTPPGEEGSILQLPVMAFAVLTLASFRMPPRWAVSLAALLVLMVGLLAVHQIGLFAVRASFSRMIHLQTFLATAVVLTALLSVAIAEMRVKTRRLEESEHRYRNFVEMSSDIVWRVELEQPMPLSLRPEQMLEWLRTHGRIAECSRSFLRVDPEDRPDAARPLRGDSMWMEVYQRYLSDIAARRFSGTDLRVTVPLDGRPRTMLASFDGVIRDGNLHRIWGIARDVTEILDLNNRLQREQERLRNYARALTTAEERARRATAVDLHDGIGQSLTGMAMTLEVVRTRVPDEVRLLLDDMKHSLREVQDRTRDMISDLSPPGLYDLGLSPALNWLAVYFRSHEKLQVTLDCRVDEARIELDLRVHAFKLVRELLRNVRKHAGVSAARVSVQQDAEALHIRVEDQGEGFVWRRDAAQTGQGGFGLWSIAERVAELGGQLDVDSAPEQGTRIALWLPLHAGGLGNADAVRAASQRGGSTA